MKYCNNCKQMVEPQKKFNVCVFILLLLFTCVGWIFYLIYYACKKGKCPMCNSKNWGIKPQQTSFSQVQPHVGEGFKYCSQCGEKIGKSVEFCNLCGTKQ